MQKGGSQGGAGEDPTAAADRSEAVRSPSPAGGLAPAGLAGFAMAAATGVKLKNLLGRVRPSAGGAAPTPPELSPTATLLTSLSGGSAAPGRFGSAFSSAPGQLSAAVSSDGPLLSIQDPAAAAAAAAAQQNTTPRFLERLASSLRRQPSRRSTEVAAAGGAALGVLVAEDDSKPAVGVGAAETAGLLPGSIVAAGTAAGDAGAAAAVSTPTSAPAAGGAGEVQAADAVVQVRGVRPGLRGT